MSHVTATGPDKPLAATGGWLRSQPPDQQLYDGLVQSVLAQVREISRQDAEDAVQEAWIVLDQKAETLQPGPIGGYLLRTARFKALQIRDRSRRCGSLDALTEKVGDASSELANPAPDSLECHLALAELEDDPIAKRALDAARKGASGRVAPRGMRHQCARYTDEQVTAVRCLRSEGLTYRRIAELTGVPAGYCTSLVKRQCRVTETTEGWTSALVLEALRRFAGTRGTAPRFRDAEGHPGLPSPKTVERHFGTWNEALRAAGIRPTYGERRVRRWTQEEMVQTFCLWRLRQDRWPNGADMANDVGLPSPATTRRHFGTQSPPRLAEAVLARLA
jgi:DNA-directed RNA polymerase specialized sigma24 family protein